MSAAAETTTYRNHELSSTFDHNAGILSVTVHDAGQISLRDAADVTYWFAYSNLMAGPGIESKGATRNEDGSITVAYRV
jgi:hypothetical protein